MTGRARPASRSFAHAHTVEAGHHEIEHRASIVLASAGRRAITSSARESTTRVPSLTSAPVFSTMAADRVRLRQSNGGSHGTPARYNDLSRIGALWPIRLRPLNRDIPPTIPEPQIVR